MTAREAALKALMAYRQKNAWPDLTLGGFVEKYDITARDAALAARILNGVMQNMMLCDHYIAHFSSISLGKIEPRVFDILRLSIYQLVFMEKIPPGAAVNEGVMLARKNANPRAAGFVNAVLRKAAQAIDSGTLPEVTGELIQRLSIKYSHPDWLVRQLCEVLDDEAAEAFLAANNEPDLPLFAQVNTLLTDTDNALATLCMDGVEAARHGWLDGCIELRGARNITRLKAFFNGLIYIQDNAARLAVMAAEPKPGDVIIDGCAAPGGKSFASAIIMKDKGTIIACDIYIAKLNRIQEGSKRLGITIIDVMEKDALTLTDEFIGKADVVLADVPCSGFGAIRKKPDIRYKLEPDIAGLPDIQKRILSVLSKYVKPGGTLLYSTCTVLRSENEGVIEWFLRENENYRLEGFSLPGAGYVQSGMITLWPHIHGTDGFFISKLRNCQAVN